MKVPDMTSTWQLRSNRSQGLPDRLKKRPSCRATMSRNDLPEPINLSVINKQTRNYSYILPTQQTCRKMCITSSNSISHSTSACCWREPQTNELRKCAKTHLHFTKWARGKINRLLWTQWVILKQAVHWKVNQCLPKAPVPFASQRLLIWYVNKLQMQ